MKVQTLAAALLTTSLLATGCSKESAPGGPGATTNPNGTTGTTTPGGTNAPSTVTNEENTFTLKVPAADYNIDQGETDEVTLSINRGKEFTQKVSLKIEPPAGLTVDPMNVDLQTGQSDVKVRITATPTATVGKTNIKVIATPETGKAVEQNFSVDVKENSDNNANTN